MPPKLKVVFVGDSGVGKTCICNRAVRGTFSEMTAGTVGANLLTLPNHEGSDLTFDIWDTAGQDQYKNLVPMYFRGAQAAIVTFDLTNLESFSHLDGWLQAIKDTAPQDCEIGLVGNKADLAGDRAVQSADAEAYGKSHNASFYIEVSAKTGANVEEIFKRFASSHAKRVAGAAAESQKVAPVIALEATPKSEARKQKCC
jgi:small GTP-binding protein